MGNKPKQKRIFLIPGWGQKPTNKCFTWLINLLQKKGFEVIKVSIDWDYRVMTDYVADFKKQYIKYAGKNNYILGFSYGAVIAFVSATELKPKKIYLCSLSPHFKEDIKAMKPWIKKLVGKRRIADAKTQSAIIIAKKLTTPSVIFYGEAEAEKFPQLIVRAKETVKYAKNVKIVVVKEAPHKIDHPEYMKAIIKELVL
jgi:pimeloyl-ACP methyl ester carboxylesterase